jgi:hypothetical protein
MEAAVAGSFGLAAQPFVDGFGERRVVLDARGEPLDILRLNATLSTVPSFESAVRERIERVGGFSHESFSRIRTIQTDKATNGLMVVSDHVRGARLSTLLTAARKRSVAIDLPATACVIRHLIRAAAAWREQMPDTVHGAIGPERIVITPDGRMILVDHVFGSALEQLHYSRQRYWEELGVALPSTFKLTINARADVLQVGAVALALVLGRRLNATDRIEDMQPAVSERSLPALRTWLLRALQLEPVGSFTSVLDARAALDQALGEPDLVEEQDGLLRFMARCLTFDVEKRSPKSSDGSGTASQTTSGSDDLAEVDLETRIEALKAFLATRRSAPGEPIAPPEPSPQPEPAAEFPQATEVAREDIPMAPEHPPLNASAPLRRFSIPLEWRRHVWLATAATALIVVALAAVVFGVLPWSRQSSTGAFSIDTRPAGVPVTIDGTPRGVTPLAVDLTAGDHLVELITSSEHRRIPVTIRAGSESSQFLEMLATAAVETSSTTELRIRTEPLGAAVTIDGQSVGKSPVSVSDLAPGTHTVVLKHEDGSATEQVLIERGKTASLFVPLAPRQSSAAAAGWISIVAAPVDVQLFESGRFLGSSKIERIMLPAGRHELDIVNETLGFQERRVVQVTAGQVAPVNLKWPTGTVSLNAAPWALAFIDGAPVGETPIANMRIPIGPHEILFRHPQLGERRESIVVTARETARVGVDLRAK